MKNQKMQIPWNSKISGIYAWENKINGKMYIGKATNLYKRVYDEMHGFRHKRHQNLKKLFNAVKKYGLDNFYVLKLLECPRKYLEKIEKSLIQYYDTKNNGYNCTFGGEGVLGHVITKNQIEKQKKSMKLYWSDERKKEHSQKMKEWFETQPSNVQKNMKEGNRWWKNPIYKEKQIRECRNSLTSTRIEKQRRSILDYYKTHTSKKAIVVSVSNSDGVQKQVIGAYKFCRDAHISYKGFGAMLRGKVSEYKGWKLTK